MLLLTRIQNVFLVCTSVQICSTSPLIKTRGVLDGLAKTVFRFVSWRKEGALLKRQPIKRQLLQILACARLQFLGYRWLCSCWGLHSHSEPQDGGAVPKLLVLEPRPVLFLSFLAGTLKPEGDRVLYGWQI